MEALNASWIDTVRSHKYQLCIIWPIAETTVCIFTRPKEINLPKVWDRHESQLEDSHADFYHDQCSDNA